MLALIARLFGLKKAPANRKAPRSATLEQIQAAKPQIILYVTGIEKVAYQANMWIPVLERLTLSSAIVIREHETAAELIPTRLPVFFLKTTRDVENLEACGARVILYPANHSKNVQCLRFHRIQHCFINHGESDKVVNQSKFLMAYDHLLVAGPLAEMRLRRAGLPLRNGQVIHVGRPQVELLLDKPKTTSGPISTILYAPTWEGFVEEANYSSVSPFGLALLETLVASTTAKILFKPHPFTGFNKSGNTGLFLEKIREFGLAHADRIELIPTEDPIHTHMNRSDLLITDISSVLNDYLYTLKPMVLTNPRALAVRRLHMEYPSSQAAHPLDDPTQIAVLLTSIQQNDHLRHIRKQVCSLSLGNFPQGSLARFDQIVTRAAMRWATYAHRGGAALRPQNTLAAFTHAIELGCPGAELDLHLTRDGHVVVHHDIALNWKRTRDSSGRWLSPDDIPIFIRDLTLEQLRSYSVGESNPAAPTPPTGFIAATGETVPTLSEVITLIKERSPNFRLVLEIKSPIEENLPQSWEPLVDTTLALLRRENAWSNITFCSFDWNALIYIKRLHPDIPTWFTLHPSSWFTTPAAETDSPAPKLTKLRELHSTGSAPWYAGFDPRKFAGGAPEAVARAGGDRLFCHHTDFDLSLMMSCARHRIGNAAWAVKMNNPKELSRLRKAGLEIFCTDYPEDTRIPEMYVFGESST